MHGHRFEINTLVLEIHENVGLVLGIKNCVQVRRSYKLMGLVFQISEQVCTHFSKKMCHSKT